MEESRATLEQSNKDRVYTGKFLNSGLDSVMEADGVVMATPSGIKKGIKKPTGKTRPEIFKFAQVTTDNESPTELLDRRGIVHLDTSFEPVTEKVQVKNIAHPHSPHVVSLRECLVLPSEVEESAVEPIAADKHSKTLAASLPEQAWTQSAMGTRLEPWYTPKLPGQVSGLKVAAVRAVSDVGYFIKSLSRFFKKEKSAVVLELERDVQAAVLDAGLHQVHPFKTVAVIAIAAFFMTLPAQALILYRTVSEQKDTVSEKGTAAVQKLLSMQSVGDISAADLKQASGMFRDTENALDESRALAIGAAALMPAEYRSAKALLEIGDKVSESGRLLAIGFGRVFNSDGTLVERLDLLKVYTDAALPGLIQAEEAASRIDASSLPDSEQQHLAALPQKLQSARVAVEQASNMSRALGSLLGRDRLRNYLIIFQNNSELRPSGGFMGSLAEVRVDRGKIVSVYTPPGGTYDLKGQLTARVQSPKQLQLINPLWQFQDANWFADFNTSANKINWFWSKSGQPTLDGIVAVNADFMLEVLRVTGPIDMPEYGKTITADNFMVETQKAVELEYDREANTPKKFIGDLFERLRARLESLDRNQYTDLAAAVSRALATKNIQVALFDPKEAGWPAEFGWAGRIGPADADALAIIGANIAGQKTDLVIKETVTHTATVNPDGRIYDTLTLTREHTGGKGDLFYGVRNVEYMRFYVPKGSVLKSASGFDPPPPTLFKQPLASDAMDPDLRLVEQSAHEATGTLWTAEEYGRTVFGGWLQLDPGQTQTIELVYELPFSIYDLRTSINQTADNDSKYGSYLLKLESQSGKSRSLTHNLVLPAGWQIAWSTEVEKPNLVSTWDRDIVTAKLIFQP